MPLSRKILCGNNEPQCIAIFLPSLNGGGAERSLLNLSAHIAARGHAVDLVLVKAVGPYMADVSEMVNVVNLNVSKALLSLPLVVKYLRSRRPVAMLSGLHVNIVAIWAKLLADVDTRVVISERNTMNLIAKNLPDPRFKLMPLLARLFYRFADEIVAVSNGVARDLADIIHLPGKRIHVIYNPVITADFRRKSRQAVDHEWFQKQSVPVIVGVGSLCPQKDFQTLIEAFYELRKRRPVRLLIMGEGEDRTALENQIVRLGLTKDVQLPGFVDNPYPYMARASVFVLSSRWEGLPGALIEALYLGVPLVATDCKSGPEEVLENGKLGKLVSVGEPTELALAIENCLDRPHPPRSADSWQRFSPQTIVSQYLNLLLQESA